MTSIVLIAPFPDCYFHLALLSHYAGSSNEYRSAPSDHSEDHRWSKFVKKNSLSLNSLCAEKAILLMAKKLPRQIIVSGFIARSVSINCIFGGMGCTMFKN